MKLTLKQKHEIRIAIDRIDRGLAFLRNANTTICRRKSMATTTLDYVNAANNKVLTPIDTEIGSDICLFDNAAHGLRRLLEGNCDNAPTA